MTPGRGADEAPEGEPTGPATGPLEGQVGRLVDLTRGLISSYRKWAGLRAPAPAGEESRAALPPAGIRRAARATTPDAADASRGPAHGAAAGPAEDGGVVRGTAPAPGAGAAPSDPGRAAALFGLRGVASRIRFEVEPLLGGRTGRALLVLASEDFTDLLAELCGLATRVDPSAGEEAGTVAAALHGFSHAAWGDGAAAEACLVRAHAGLLRLESLGLPPARAGDARPRGGETAGDARTRGGETADKRPRTGGAPTPHPGATGESGPRPDPPSLGLSG